MQLHYHCYMNDTGYSIAAQDYLLSLRKSHPELNIKLSYLNQLNTGVSKNRVQLFQAMKKQSDQAEQVNLFHSIPHRYRRVRGDQKHLGLCLFETMDPPDKWIELMGQMDGIITASEFNRRIFETHNVKVPIHVVPHAFDDQLFNKHVLPTGRYNLFTFFTVGTWKHKTRKNYESLVKAFYDAFEEKDRVCLLVKTDNTREFTDMVKHVKRAHGWRSKDTAPIYAEEKNHCQFEEIPSLMRKGDVYVCASLGEGFGLPGLQAMALGIPVITTKFGGTLEYAKPEYCTYIEPKHYKTYPIMDNVPQFRGCIWPVIRISEIRDRLREVYENRELAQVKAMKAYTFVHKNFNYETIGNKLLEAIKA